MPLSFRASFTLIIASCIAIAIFYTNCAQNLRPQEGRSARLAEAAYQPLTQLQRGLVKQYGTNLTPHLCTESSRYFCDHRIYSPRVPDQVKPIRYECTPILGLMLCAQGLEILINSSDLVRNCGSGACDTSDKESSDYFCYFALPNQNGTYPIQGHFSSLEEGLREIRQRCQDLSQQSQAGE